MPDHLRKWIKSLRESNLLGDRFTVDFNRDVMLRHGSTPPWARSTEQRSARCINSRIRVFVFGELSNHLLGRCIRSKLPSLNKQGIRWLLPTQDIFSIIVGWYAATLVKPIPTCSMLPSLTRIVEPLLQLLHSHHFALYFQVPASASQEELNSNLSENLSVLQCRCKETVKLINCTVWAPGAPVISISAR